MTLVWANMPRGDGSIQAQMTPQELMQHPAGQALSMAKSPFGRKMLLGPLAGKVGPLADSIRQHGYQPEIHGHLHLEQREDGWSAFHATGYDEPGHPLHGTTTSGQAGKVLALALHESGHTSQVPVHAFNTSLPEKPNLNTQEEEEEDFPGKGVTYYHGTIGHPYEDHPTGEITPAREHGQGVIFKSDTSADHAYATTKVEDAWRYAEKAFDHAGSEGVHVPKVYEVRATGPVEKDPTWDDRFNRSRGNYENDYRSKHPFLIEREIDPSDDVRERYYSYVEGHGR